MSLPLYVSLSLWVSLPVGYDDGLMTDALARRTDQLHIHPHPMLTISSCVPITYFYTFLHIFALIQTCFSACQKTFFVILANVCRGFVSRVNYFVVFFHGYGITVLVRREQDSPSDEHERQTQVRMMRGSPHCPERHMKLPPLREGWDEQSSVCAEGRAGEGTEDTV